MAAVVAWVWLAPAQPAHAEALHYSVAAQLPENQIDKSISYFDLLVKPGTTQTLNVLISNTDTTAHNYRVQVVRATTNTNGAIDYTKRGVTPAKSLAVDLERLTPKATTVSVPAQTKQTVPIKVQLPAKHFTGVVLGGIRVQELDSTKQSKSKGLQLNNKFAYVLGVSLQEDADYTKIAPVMVLHSVSAKQRNYRNTITANLENTVPNVMHKVKIDATITKQGESNPYLTVSKDKMTLAPNSNFAFPISTKNKPLEAGDYTLNLTASASDGQYHWQFKKNFTITRQKASKLNKTAVDQKAPKGTNWLIVGLIIVGALLVIAIIIALIFLLKPQKKKRK